MMLLQPCAFAFVLIHVHKSPRAVINCSHFALHREYRLFRFRSASGYVSVLCNACVVSLLSRATGSVCSTFRPHGGPNLVALVVDWLSDWT
jgi:hypothetical protein